MDSGTARPSSRQIPHAEEPAGKSLPHEAPVPRPEVSRNDAGDVPEPAPVVPAARPVAPGGTARIVVPLVNEDDRPAQIEFFGTGLVGDDGAVIPATCVSCRSRGLTLEAGVSGDVEIEVSVPANARAGVYAGLVRASRLDDVHAVIVIRVDAS